MGAIWTLDSKGGDSGNARSWRLRESPQTSSILPSCNPASCEFFKLCFNSDDQLGVRQAHLRDSDGLVGARLISIHMSLFALSLAGSLAGCDSSVSSLVSIGWTMISKLLENSKRAGGLA